MIPSRTQPGLWVGPQLGREQKATYGCFSPSLSLSHPLSSKMNFKKKFYASVACTSPLCSTCPSGGGCGSQVSPLRFKTAHAVDDVSETLFSFGRGPSPGDFGATFALRVPLCVIRVGCLGGASLGRVCQ